MDGKIEVVTGRGMHSLNNIPVIFQEIKKFLFENKFKFQDNLFKGNIMIDLT